MESLVLCSCEGYVVLVGLLRGQRLARLTEER
jgi:hypothetical protein